MTRARKTTPTSRPCCSGTFGRAIIATKANRETSSSAVPSSLEIGDVIAAFRGPFRRRRTLLAVCPNSTAVTRAALRASHVHRTPILLAATLNQVDLQHGYTGWTPDALACFVRETIVAEDLHAWAFLCLDHGGPWKKDHHHQLRTDEDVFVAVAAAIEACVEAGYSLLHIDATGKPKDADAPKIETLVERTMTLMGHAEAHRRAIGRGPLAYEVGVEESGSVPVNRLSDFLGRVLPALRASALPAPSFVVGDIGTALDTTDLDPAKAGAVVQVADRHDLLVKAHYSDGVTHLSRYPELGIGGANIGPGLAETEYRALEALCQVADRSQHSTGLVGAIRKAVVESERWRKWIAENDSAVFEDLPEPLQSWLVATGSRYVWTHPDVAGERGELRHVLRGEVDTEDEVQRRLSMVLDRFVTAFNLSGTTDLLRGSATAAP